MRRKHILIMAGGTGGHIYPGLAVAKCFLAQGIAVSWLGSEGGMELELVTQDDISMHAIKVRGLRGKGKLSLLLAPLLIISAMWQALCILRRIKPDLVIGLGGYASGPGGIVAWLLRKPLIVHEQNTKAGMTNRILSYFADSVLQGFPHTFAQRCHAVDTGNPVRAEMFNLPTPRQRFAQHEGRLRVLVLGGSRGALRLNEVVPQALALMPEIERPAVWQQTGTLTYLSTQAQCAELGVDIRLQDYIADMAQAYIWADLVICRAGALTVSELTAAGAASVMIPFPYAVDDHQTTNAQYLVNAGAGMMVKQDDLSPQYLVELLRSFTQDREPLLRMAELAQGLAKKNATQAIVDECLKYLGGESIEESCKVNE